HLGNYHWPTFNVADSAISIGMFLLFWYFYREKK
ncbi:MAG: signal peptidase II, partial [Thermodesulfobacteriota bacterium]